MFEIYSFSKNAAKLHFLFHSTKYLSKNSQKQAIFFQFVNCGCQFLDDL